MPCRASTFPAWPPDQAGSSLLGIDRSHLEPMGVSLHDSRATGKGALPPVPPRPFHRPSRPCGGAFWGRTIRDDGVEAGNHDVECAS